MELNDLLGQYMLIDGGSMKWIDGPLTLAVRLAQGHGVMVVWSSLLADSTSATAYKM